MGAKPLRIYFAAPLFSEGERTYNAKLAKMLENNGFDVFLPQRDGIESNQHPFNEMNIEEVRKAIFDKDRDQILSAEIFLFILDGRVPDEGACVELGIAYGQKFHTKEDKLIIGLLTDMRSAFPEAKLNAMIEGALDCVVFSEKALIDELNKFKM